MLYSFIIGSVFLIFLVYFVCVWTMIFGWITSKVTVLATNFDGNFTTISDTGVTFVDLFQEEYNTKKEKEKKKVYMAPLN